MHDLCLALSPPGLTSDFTFSKALAMSLAVSSVSLFSLLSLFSDFESLESLLFVTALSLAASEPFAGDVDDSSVSLAASVVSSGLVASTIMSTVLGDESAAEETRDRKILRKNIIRNGNTKIGSSIPSSSVISRHYPTRIRYGGPT